MNDRFAKNLAAVRKRLNLTQKDLAAKLFVTRQAVSKWERGETEPDIVTLCAISRMFDVSLDDLLQKDCTAPAAVTTANVVENSEAENLQLKSTRKKKLAKQMSLFALFDIAFCCLLIGIIFTATVDLCDLVWIIWFALPVLVHVLFALRFRNEIGAAWIMYFFPVPFVSGIIYLLVHELTSSPGAWLAFLLIPLYYAVAVIVTVGTRRKKQ